MANVALDYLVIISIPVNPTLDHFLSPHLCLPSVGEVDTNRNRKPTAFGK